MKLYGFIYLTINLVNGRKYIGKKIYDSNSRTYLGSGTLLRKAIEKYGRDNFKRTILEECATDEELSIAEVKWIRQFNAVKNKEFYNLAEGGTGGMRWKSIPHPMSGKRHREETKIKMSESRTGNKNGIFQKGYLLKGDRNGRYGSKATKKSIERSKEVNSKMIICIDTNVVYPSIAEAARQNHFNRTNINACCTGRYNKAHGMKWQYYDEYLKENQSSTHHLTGAFIMR